MSLFIPLIHKLSFFIFFLIVFPISFGEDEKGDKNDDTLMTHYIVPGTMLKDLSQVFSILVAYWKLLGRLETSQPQPQPLRQKWDPEIGMSKGA